MSWDRGLHAKHKAFIMAYVRSFNATAAYLEAYTAKGMTRASAATRAHALMQRDDVKAALSSLMSELVSSDGELKAMIMADARASLEDFVSVDGFGDLEWDWNKAKAAGALRHLKKLKIKEREGIKEISIELIDRQRAQDMLLKTRGLYRAEAPNDDAGQGQDFDLSKLTEDELDLFEALLSKVQGGDDE